MTDPSSKQWCRKISVEEFNRVSKENTECEVKKLLDQINKQKKENTTQNVCNELSNVSIDTPDENSSNDNSIHYLSINNSSDKDLIIKIMNQNNSLKETLHSLKIKHIDLKNSFTNLEKLEYNQRLELENRNIKIEEFTDILKNKTEEFDHQSIDNISFKKKINKYRKANSLYILLCMLLSVIVFLTQIYIRYFTKYRPAIMTWLFTGGDNYC